MHRLQKFNSAADNTTYLEHEDVEPATKFVMSFPCVDARCSCVAGGLRVSLMRRLNEDVMQALLCNSCAQRAGVERQFLHDILIRTPHQSHTSLQRHTKTAHRRGKINHDDVNGSSQLGGLGENSVSRNRGRERTGGQGGIAFRSRC